MQKSTEPGPGRAPSLRVRAIRGAVVAFIAVLVAGLGVVLHRFDLPLVDTFDRHVGDWRIALGSPKAAAQRQDIAIVLITERTLLDYESRSPIDRALLAKLVREIDAARPKAIGLDIIFDRRTRHDEPLFTALREAKSPVVLGRIVRWQQGMQQESLDIQDELLSRAGRPSGHLMLGRREGMLTTNDSVVRYIASPHPGEAAGTVVGGARSGQARRALAEPFVDVLARAAQITHRPPNGIISWQRAPSPLVEVFTTIPIDRHKPEDLQRSDAFLLSDGDRSRLANRIVLIGAAMLDRDQHLTPLSVLDRSQVPGVMIHAQALAQRIDGNRDIHRLRDSISGLAAAAVALACFMIARHTGFSPRGVAYGPVGGALIALSSFVAYAHYRIDFPSIALATAWMGGGAAGFASDWIFRRLGLDDRHES